jgi:hypothetical protein
MTRQVAGPGPETITAPLVWSGDHWEANFEQANVACQGAGDLVPGVEDSTWTIRLNASGTITATESTSTHDAACLTATSTLRWSASKLSKQQLAPA